MKLKLLIPVLMLLATAAHAQNVGIGTQIPSYMLTVKDSSGASFGQGIAQVSPDGLVAVGTYVDNAGAYIQTHTNHDLNFSTDNGSPKITLQKTTGNVGIGTATPSEKLHIAGNARISGTVQIQGGTPGTGKILTSDATGSATWQSPSGITPAAISSSGFVGIIDEAQTSLTVASSATAQVLPFIEYSSVAYTFDDGNNLNGSYTVPSNGFYHFEVTLNLLNPPTASQDGSIFVSLFKNGATMAPMSSTKVYSGEVLPNTINGGSINIKLQAGDIISVRFGQNSGQPITLFNSALNGPATRFSGYRIY